MTPLRGWALAGLLALLTPMAAAQPLACDAVTHLRALPAILGNVHKGDKALFAALAARSEWLRNLPAADPSVGGNATVHQDLALLDAAVGALLPRQALFEEIHLAFLRTRQHAAEVMRMATELQRLEHAEHSVGRRLSGSAWMVQTARRVHETAGPLAHSGNLFRAEDMFTIARDLNDLHAVLQGMLHGSTDLKLPRAPVGPIRARVEDLQGPVAALRQNAGVYLANLHVLAFSEQAHQAALETTRRLGPALEKLCPAAR